MAYFLQYNMILTLFFIILFGLLLGKIRFRGKTIGISGVLISGLIAGHFGAEVSIIVQSIGMVLFVTSVGLKAGENLKQAFSRYGRSYLLITISTLGFSLLLTLILANLFQLKAELTVGMMVGALTSTPGLGAALESTGGSELVGAGYAMAYPFGAIGVVGGIHLICIFYRRHKQKEDQSLPCTGNPEAYADNSFNRGTIVSFVFIIFFGILLGQVPLFFPWIGTITLGLAGGPLLIAIIFGHYGSIGPIKARFHHEALNLIIDLGAVFVLAQVGVSAGKNFWLLAQQYGAIVLFCGFLITLFSAGSTFLLCVFAAKMNMENTVGTVAGVMTSTPGLVAAIEATENDMPAVAYGAVYPVAVLINSIIAKIVVASLV